jgi:hypothetical protein
MRGMGPPLSCDASTSLAAVSRPVVTDRKTTRRIRERSVGAVHNEAAGQDADGGRVPQLTVRDRPDASVSKTLPQFLWHRTLWTAVPRRDDRLVRFWFLILIGGFVTLDL